MLVFNLGAFMDTVAIVSCGELERRGLSKQQDNSQLYYVYRIIEITNSPPAVVLWGSRLWDIPELHKQSQLERVRSS